MTGEEQISIGGVNFRGSDVKKSTVKKSEDGNKMFCVWLENGTKIEYPEQKDGKVDTYSHGFLKKDYHTVLNNLNGAKIIGSENDDTYSLYYCKGTQVDVKDNDPGFFDGDTVHISVGNKDITVKTDGSDEVIYYKNGKEEKRSRTILDFHQD